MNSKPLSYIVAHGLRPSVFRCIDQRNDVSLGGRHQFLGRNAFTLVELLVVIAIIGILIAMLLPAVQAAREAARRLQCSNNLKQMGVAMHSHLSANNAFPPGSYWKPNSELHSSGNEATWITFLLPYLEEQALYEMIDWEGPDSFGNACDPPYTYRKIAGEQLPMMLCPSAEHDTELWLNGFAKGNYAANNGEGPMIEWFEPPTDRMAGVFHLEGKRIGCKASDISDGLSNTAFVSEILMVPKDGNKEDMRGVMHYPEGPLYHHNRTPNDLYPDQVRPSNCVSTPMAPCQESIIGYRATVLTARSLHPGGVNFLLGDGSVSFMSSTVTLDIWQALGTPNKGDLVSSSSEF